MTREMNKPEWWDKWIAYNKHPIYISGDMAMDSVMYAIQSWDFTKEKPRKRERVLDDWIEPFFERCSNFERLEK